MIIGATCPYDGCTYCEGHCGPHSYELMSQRPSKPHEPEHYPPDESAKTIEHIVHIARDEPERITPPAPSAPMTVRTFETGATRDVDADKLDLEGFISPIVTRRFSEYMHKNRFQRDGSVRASDNWQKGIPLDAYMKSLMRHVLDLWLRHRGFDALDDEMDLEDVLCAIRFNADGYLFETLKRKD